MKLRLIAHNIRSAHNVGSLMRSCDGLGVEKLYLCGYTPAPAFYGDDRLPHVASKLSRQISKTALGAEKYLNWEYLKDVTKVIEKLKNNAYSIVALEQTADAVEINNFVPPAKMALLIGREVEGIEPELLKLVNAKIHIQMEGKKESFNVAVAAAIAIWALKHKGK